MFIEEEIKPNISVELGVIIRYPISEHNPITDANFMDKYLCNTIEESIKSIDQALSIKDYRIK
jgi:hypothetical protein